MAHAVLAEALSDGGCALGARVSSSAEGVAETLDRAGYDFMGFDCQHGRVSETEAAQLLRRLGHARAAMLVRVSDNSAPLIGKVLDAGADGVIVPMVNSAAEARRAVAACRYAPAGIRSFGPNRTGLPFDAGLLEERVSCFFMIETADGIANAQEICGIPGLAGVVVGPGDLSIALGMKAMEGFSTDQIYGALATIRAACELNEIVLGIFAGPSGRAEAWVSQGVRLLILGSDMGLMAQAAVADVAAGESAVGRR